MKDPSTFPHSHSFISTFSQHVGRRQVLVLIHIPRTIPVIFIVFLLFLCFLDLKSGLRFDLEDLTLPSATSRINNSSNCGRRWCGEPFKKCQVWITVITSVLLPPQYQWNPVLLLVSAPQQKPIHFLKGIFGILKRLLLFT